MELSKDSNIIQDETDAANSGSSAQNIGSSGGGIGSSGGDGVRADSASADGGGKVTRRTSEDLGPRAHGPSTPVSEGNPEVLKEQSSRPQESPSITRGVSMIAYGLDEVTLYDSDGNFAGVRPCHVFVSRISFDLTSRAVPPHYVLRREQLLDSLELLANDLEDPSMESRR